MPPRKTQFLIDTDADLDGVNRTERGVDKLGRAFGELGRDSTKLDVRLRATKERVQALARQISELDAEDVDLSKKFRGEAAALRKLEAVKRQLDDVGDEAEQAGRKIAGIGSFAGGGVDQLKLRIAESSRLLRTLAQDLSRAGTGDVDLNRRFAAEKRHLAQLRSLMADVGDESGRGFSRGFADAIGALPSQLKGALIVSAVGAAVAASPFLGAAIGAAVVGGVGLGGIIGGVALAARDRRVKDLGAEVGRNIGAAFTEQAQVFVGPTLQALRILDDAGQKFAKGLHFEGIAQELAPIAKGLAGFAEKLLPGLNRALEAARPLLRVIARELPELGDAFTDMFNSISDGSDGAILALEFLFDFIEGSVRTIGVVIGFLEDRFTDAVQGMAAVTGVLEDVLGHIPGVPMLIAKEMRVANDESESLLKRLRDAKQPIESLGHDGAAALDDLGHSMFDLGRWTSITANAQKILNDEWAEALGLALSLDEANLRVQQDFLKLRDAINENGTSLSTATEKGLANREMLLGMIGDLQHAREAAIRQGGGSQEATRIANAAYESQMNKLRDLAIRLGVPKKALDELIAKYRGVPKDIPTTARVVGLDVAKKAIDKLKGWLSSIPNSVSTSVNVGLHGFAMAEGGILAAQRGVITNHPTVLFGERGTGKEAYIPMRGISENRAASLLSEAASWYGMGVGKPMAAGSLSSGYAAPVSATPPRPAVVQLAYVGAGGHGLDGLFVDWLYQAIREGRIQLTTDPTGRVKTAKA